MTPQEPIERHPIREGETLVAETLAERCWADRDAAIVELEATMTQEPIKHTMGVDWAAKPCEDRSCWHVARNGKLVATIADEATARELAELLSNRNRLRLEMFPILIEMIRRLRNSYDLASQGVQRSDLKGAIQLDRDLESLLARVEELQRE